MSSEAETSAARTSHRPAIFVALVLALGALLGVAGGGSLVPSVLGSSTAADRAGGAGGHGGGSKGGGSGGGSKGGGSGGGGAGVTDAVSVTGHIEGLFPGAHSPLVLTVRNHKPFEIVLTSLEVTVDDASDLCRASNVTVDPFVGSMPISGRGTRPVVVTVRMAAGAPGSCQAATWPLHYLAHVEKP